MLVLGAGPIGLAVALAARPRVERLLVADISAERVAFAAASGLEALVVDEHEPQLRDRAAVSCRPLVFDASGSRTRWRPAFGLDGRGRQARARRPHQGALSFDEPRRSTPASSKCGRPGTRRSRDWTEVIAATRDGALDALGWINHRTTLAGIVEELPGLAAGTGIVLKTVVDVGGDAPGASA